MSRFFPDDKNISYLFWNYGVVDIHGLTIGMNLLILGCNLDLKTNRGTIFSPGYGLANYPPVLLCSWLIQTEAGRPLLLRFRDFRLQENMDYVQVHFVFFMPPPLQRRYLGQFWVQLSNFQQLCPLDLEKNYNFLQLMFIFFAGVAHT